jgi:nucleotide-binding universal stress UspA family protein
MSNKQASSPRCSQQSRTRRIEEDMNMLPLKKIMWPTDFSEYSYQALEVAEELAQHFSAELVLVHVVGSVPVAPVLPGVAPAAFNVAKYQKELEMTSMRTVKDIADKRISKVSKVSTVVGHGEAGNEIVRLAESEDVDLVVISTHGMSGLERILFGSIAEKVVRIAKCPVLTVRAVDKAGNGPGAAGAGKNR